MQKDKWKARKDLISETHAASSLSRPSVLSSQNSISLWELERWSENVHDGRVSNSLQNSNLLAQEWIWRILKLCTNCGWEDDFLIAQYRYKSASKWPLIPLPNFSYRTLEDTTKPSQSSPSPSLDRLLPSEPDMCSRNCDDSRDMWIAKPCDNLWHTKPTPATDSCIKYKIIR